MGPVRRLFAPIAAVAVGALLIAGVASAEDRYGGGGGLGLPGVIEAEGDGIAAASGKLTLKLCASNGLVLTKGAVTLEEGATYEDTVSWLGLNVYWGFNGCATIGPEDAVWGLTEDGGNYDGSKHRRTAALAVGEGLTLQAVGYGKVFLKGTGTWSDALGGSGEWSDQGTILKLGSY